MPKHLESPATHSTELGKFTHYFEFGDGGWDTAETDGLGFDTTKYYTHSYEGFFTVTDDIVCSCADGTMFYYDTLPRAQRNVLVVLPPSCAQADIDGYNNSGLLGRSETIANRYYMFLSNWAGGIFRFKLIANGNDVPDSGDQSALGSQASVWTRLKDCAARVTRAISAMSGRQLPPSTFE